MSDPIHHIDLLNGVIVMAEIDAQGSFLTLPSLAAKIKAVRNNLRRIHTIVVAEDQNEKKPEDGAYTLIKAKNYPDLIRQLEDNGGLFGEELRRRAREESSALWLPDNRTAQADWKQLYQLPRLKKVEVIDKSLSRPGEDEEQRRMSISGYEEALGAEQFDEIDTNIKAEDFADDLLCSASFRAIILGPPGAGKSSLLGWLTVRLAQQKPTDWLRPFPLLVRLAEWEEKGPKLALEDHLVALTQKALPDDEGKRRKYLCDWLRKGRLILLFDGLDEIGEPFFRHFAKSIKELKRTNSRFVVSCRTVSRGRTDALNLPIHYIDALTPEQRDAYIGAFPWEDEQRRAALKDHLPHAPNIHALSCNPLMLSFLCHTLDRDADIALPLVRVELIGAMLRNMLSEEPKGRARPEALEKTLAELARRNFRPQTLLTWQGKIAFALFENKGKSSLVFGAQRFEKICQKKTGLDDELLGLFITEMQWRGLLRPHPGGYMFFHLTVQEYLVALELARRIEKKKGLKKKLAFGDEKKPLGEWLYDWSIDPRWEEIMLLTAGLLDEPASYLDHIFCEARDTLFRHRLALAARMTGEVTQGKYDKAEVKKTAGKILDTARDIWIASDNEPVQKLVLGQINKTALVLWERPDSERKNDPVFKSNLLSQNKVNNPWAITIVRELKAVLNSNQLVEFFLNGASEKNCRYRIHSILALGDIGNVGENNRVITTLIDNMRDQDNEVIAASTIALRRFGKISETNELMSILIRNTKHSDGRVAVSASSFLSSWSTSTRPPDIVRHIIQGLAGNTGFICMQIGHSPPFCSGLKKLVVMNNLSMKLSAMYCETISIQMKESVNYNEIALNNMLEEKIDIQCFQQALRHYNWKVRFLSIRTISQQITKYSHMLIETFQELLEHINDRNKDIRRAAIVSMFTISEHEKSDELIPIYLKALNEGTPGIQRVPLSLLGILANNAQEKQSIEFIIAYLLKLFKNGEGRVAAEPIFIMGTKAANREIIQSCIQHLDHEDCETREIACTILGRVGIPENNADGLQKLIQGLNDKRWELGCLMANSLGKVDLSFEYKKIYSTITFVLAELGPTKIRSFINGLATFGLAANRPPITTLLKECAASADQPEEVRQAARDALINIRGE